MRIIVHDYVGHPFQVQLSRELARRGHEVLHLYCSSFVTPRGELTRRDDDPPGFNCRGHRTLANHSQDEFLSPPPA